MTHRFEREPSSAYPPTGELTSERRRLVGLVYRMTGSLADGEDIAQEAYARWIAMSDAQRAAVESPSAWLTTVASRICLDMLGSARARHERYVGDWIPEPISDRMDWIGAPAVGSSVDPADRIALDESVRMAFLVVLDSVTPAERVAFILHDVFRYRFAEIAEMVDRSPGACRQLAASARRRVRTAPAGTAPTAGHDSASERSRLVAKLMQAWKHRDIEAITGLLDDDAVLIADGGGRAAAARRPVKGADRVAGYLLKFPRRNAAVTVSECLVNAQPGLMVRQNDVTVTVAAFDVADGRITRIWAIRNPDKLCAFR